MKQRLPQLRLKHLGFIRFSPTGSGSGRPLTLQSYPTYLLHLLKTRPLLLLSGVWLSIFLVSMVALGSLLSPSFSSRRPPAQIAADAQASVASDPEINREGQVPFWVFAAIALSCAGGTYLLARYLQSPNFPMFKPARKSVKRPAQASPSKQESPSTPSPAEHSKHPRELKPFTPTASLPFAALPTFAQPLPPPATQPAHPKAIQDSARKNLIAWLTQDLEYVQPSLPNPLGALTAFGVEASDPEAAVPVAPANESQSLDGGEIPREITPTSRHRLHTLQAWLAEM